MKSPSLLMLVLLAAASLSFGQAQPLTLTVIPANPTTNDSIVVRVDPEICVWAPNVTFVGATAIAIDATQLVCPGSGLGFGPLQFPIGRLPSGTYSIAFELSGRLYSSTSFTVGGATIPAAEGGLSIIPAQPNDTDYISIRFLGSEAIDSGAFPLACLHGDSAFRRVTLANNVIRIEKLAEEPITIDYVYVPLPPVVPSVPAHEVWSGRLVAGDYRVELYCSLYDTIRYASANFTVKPSYMTNVQRKNPLLNPPRPMASYSGQWTPETELGWGLFLNQVESRQLAVTLFLYAPDSRSVWYYCGGGQWESVFTYRTPCSKFVGTAFGLPFQGIQEVGSGTVVLRFAGPPVSGQPERLGVAASLENVVTVDLQAEGQQLTGKRFIRIR